MGQFGQEQQPAAAMITQALYLTARTPHGQEPTFIYDPAGSSYGSGGDYLSYNNHYPLIRFFMDKFLERIAGGDGLGSHISCAGTSAAVCCFAGSIGCQLWQLLFIPTVPGAGGDFTFQTTVVLPAGLPDVAANWGRQQFPFHIVALGSYRYDPAAPVYDWAVAFKQPAGVRPSLGLPLGDLPLPAHIPVSYIARLVGATTKRPFSPDPVPSMTVVAPVIDGYQLQNGCQA
jgi:hypothetical protein